MSNIVQSLRERVAIINEYLSQANTGYFSSRDSILIIDLYDGSCRMSSDFVEHEITISVPYSILRCYVASDGMNIYDASTYLAYAAEAMLDKKMNWIDGSRVYCPKYFTVTDIFHREDSSLVGLKLKISVLANLENSNPSGTLVKRKSNL